ncbi:hypothetical protein JL720_7305 [Aureococcus anophagefferens]|nr:hypothetical protein JL720_7305 [Aureococcus anophagefferens]
MSVSATMKRLVLVEASGDDLTDAKLELEECPTPTPKATEVLVKVAAAPINPSDYGSWRSKRGDGPVPIGNEGSGVVVAVGSVIAATVAGLRVGAKVGFVGAKKQGAYSEYVAAPLATTFAMPDALPVEDACSFFMLVKLAKLEGAGDALLNVVRSEKQKAILESLGAAHVVVVADAKTDEAGVAALKAKMAELKVTCAFDAVAGAMAGCLFTNLPPKATLYSYGRLSGDIEGVAPVDLIYRGKKLEGFFLTAWLTGGFPGARLLSAAAKVRAGLGEGGWCATTFVDCAPEAMWDKFVDRYTTTGFTDRKLRIRFPE